MLTNRVSTVGLWGRIRDLEGTGNEILRALD